MGYYKPKLILTYSGSWCLLILFPCNQFHEISAILWVLLWP